MGGDCHWNHERYPASQDAQMGRQQSFHHVKELRPHHEQPEEAPGMQRTDNPPSAKTSNLIK